MKPLRLPVDAAVPVKDFLKSFAATEYSAALSLPKGWTSRSLPAVVVAEDPGEMGEWPVYTGSQIRVTVWADGRDKSRMIAGKCVGRLLAMRVPGVANIRPGSSLIDDRDEATGAFLAGFTVRVRTRTASF